MTSHILLWHLLRSAFWNIPAIHKELKSKATVPTCVHLQRKKQRANQYRQPLLVPPYHPLLLLLHLLGVTPALNLALSILIYYVHYVYFTIISYCVHLFIMCQYLWIYCAACFKTLYMNPPATCSFLSFPFVQRFVRFIHVDKCSSDPFIFTAV